MVVVPENEIFRVHFKLSLDQLSLKQFRQGKLGRAMNLAVNDLILHETTPRWKLRKDLDRKSVV